MSAWVVLAFAKINLGLQILRRRPDGYHEVRTVLQTISLCDRIEIDAARRFSFTTDDPRLPADDTNLVVRAVRAFDRAAHRNSRVRIHLRKRIPSGAGLGGGSSDAAVTLLALNQMHGFPLSASTLRTLATDLGSDVPFFLTGGTALALGRGEILHAIPDLPSCWVVVVTPDFRISTDDAYRRFDRAERRRAGHSEPRRALPEGADGAALTRRRGQTSIYRFSRQRVRAIRPIEPFGNDLERAVAPSHSGLRGLLHKLREAGAVGAAMTGSGSAVYGLFAGGGEAHRALRSLTEPPVAQAWLGRTMGAAEYSAWVRFR